ncbi:MAG TPA: hypothetical protein VFQ44_01275 [Streptosporangiaceae bacterium]|nr:hypothetical protein [Streptosporangiaceae bacterium]
MEVINQTIRYAGARAYKFGRRLFRSDAGAITLEWIIIAALLVAVASTAGAVFKSVVISYEAKLK